MRDCVNVRQSFLVLKIYSFGLMQGCSCTVMTDGLYESSKLTRPTMICIVLVRCLQGNDIINQRIEGVSYDGSQRAMRMCQSRIFNKKLVS
jgi:hypothetical protein